MENTKIELNKIFFTIAGICAFIGLSNMLAITEGVNAPQEPSGWLWTGFWFAVAGLVSRLLGKLAQAR